VKLSQKFIMTGAAFVLLSSAVALTGVGVASAAKAAASGTVSCTAAAGSVTFAPPLVSTGPYVSEKTTAKVNFTSCTGSVTTPTKGAINSVLTSITTDQCPPPTVQGSSGGSLTIKWAPGKIEPSVVAFSTHGSGTGGPDGGLGFIYPGTGGTGSVSGSYGGTDGGKTSTAAVYSNLGSTALLQQCASKTGLKKMTIVGGSIDLK
jgi:hypothetical protein